MQHNDQFTLFESLRLSERAYIVREGQNVWVTIYVTSTSH